VTADQLERESREHDDEINIQRPGDCPFGLNVAFYPLEAAGIMSGNNRMGHLPSFSAGASGCCESATTVLGALSERQLL